MNLSCRKFTHPEVFPMRSALRAGRDGRAVMKDGKIIAALNELIEASKEGEKELMSAAEHALEPELARAVSDAEAANRSASAELQDQVRLLGSTAEREGTFRAAARRSWKRVRSMVSSRNDSVIVEECVRDQGSVRALYADALELDLPEPLHSVVERNHRVIVDTHYRLLDLRNRCRDNSARALRAND
jgi:uncharacterized protein (TIGR02284 family)